MKTIITSRTLRLAAAAVFLSSSAAFAQTVWSGNSTGNWNVADNWIGGVLPASGADIVFYASTANLSNTATFMGSSGRNVGNLTFNANATQDISVRLTTGDANTATGNLTFSSAASKLTIDSGATANVTIGSSAHGNVFLAGDLTVDHASTGNLTIPRPIGETGGNRSLTKNGTGTLVLGGANPFTGGLVINNGVVRAVGGCATITDVGAGAVTLGGGKLQFVNTAWAGNKNYSTAAFNIVTTAATNSTVEYVNETITSRTLTLGGGSTTLNGDLLIKNLNASGANPFAYSQAISGAGKLSYESSTDIFTNIAERRLQLGGNNTNWSGGLEIRKGSVYATANGTLGTGSITLGVTGSSDNAALYHAPGSATTVAFANDIIITSGNGTRMLQGAGSAASVTWGGNLTLDGNLTYSAGSGVTNTISGNIAGAGGITKTDTGTLILNGNNSGLLGGLAIKAGLLSGGNTNSFGTGSITLGQTGNSTAASVGVRVNVNYPNDILVTAGGTRTIVGEGVNIATPTFSGNITLNSDLNVDLRLSGGTNALRLTGNISGNGNVTYSRPANAADYIGLLGDNTYVGNTVINAPVEVRLGTGFGNAIPDASRVIIANDHANQALNLRGGDETIGSLEGGTAASQVTFLDNATLTTGGNNLSTTYAGVFTESGGGGNLLKVGAGTFTLTGNGGYSGSTRIAAGALEVGNSLALQKSTVDMNGADSGNLIFSSSVTGATFGGLTGPRNISLLNATPAAVSLTVGTNNGTTTYSGNLIGGGSFSKNGTGTLTLSGTNTYAGPTTVNAGTLVILSKNSLPGWNTPGAYSLAGGVMSFGSAFDSTDIATILGTGNLGANPTLGIDTTDGNNVLNGDITAPGNGTLTLVKTGPNTLTLGGNNSFTDGTWIYQGTLALNSANALGTAGSIKFPGSLGGTLAHSANNTADYSARIDSTGSQAVRIDTNGQDITWASALTGTGTSLTKVGAGTLFLGNTTSSYSGATRIEGGVLDVTLLANGGANSTIGNSTNAAANLVLAGGTLRFSGTTASTTSTDRLFTVSANSTIDASGTGNSGALVRFTNTGNILWGTANQTRTLTLNAGTVGNNIIDSNITDNGEGAVAIVKDGGGNWQFTANNTYSGGTTINGGFLRIGAGTASGTVGSGDVTLNGGTLSSGRIDTFDLNNLITGNGTVHMNNTGVMVLTNNNTYSGTTNVNASGGTIQMGNGGTSGSIGTSNVFINTGGTFRINRSDDVIIGGTITGAGNITKTGSNTLTLTLTNTFTSQLNIEQGAVSSSSLDGSSEIFIGSSGNDARLIFTGGSSITTLQRMNFVAGNNGTIEVTNPNTTLSLGLGSLGGTTSRLVKEGPGTLNLSSNQTFHGDTIVNEGTLLLNSIKIATGGALLIYGNTTLGGSGNTTNAILSENGIIAPGLTAEPGVVGTLTALQALDIEAGAEDEFGNPIPNAPNSTLAIDLAGDACDKLVLTNGNFTPGTFKLAINATGTQTLPAYVIVDSGNLNNSGPFLDITGLPDGYTVAYNYNDGTDTNNIAIVTGTAPSPFSTYMVAMGLEGAAMIDDNDNDGYSNLEEFMFDGQPNPANGNASAKPIGAPTQTLDATYLTITYGRSQTAMTEDGISVGVEYSTNLGTWATAQNGVGGVVITEFLETAETDGFGSEVYSGDLGIDKIEVKIPRSLAGSGGKLFARVKINVP